MNLSDQLEDARSGSAAAQKYLFDHFADPMMALCCRYVKNRADTEELVPDGFYKGSALRIEPGLEFNNFFRGVTPILRLCLGGF